MKKPRKPETLEQTAKRLARWDVNEEIKPEIKAGGWPSVGALKQRIGERYRFWLNKLKGEI